MGATVTYVESLEKNLGLGFDMSDDFETALVASNLGWTTVTAGLASAVIVNTANVDSNHFGIRELQTGLLATGRAGYYLSLNQRLLGGSKTFFETLVRIPTLSVLAQRYTVRLGLGDIWNVATITPAQGVFFEYNEAASLNWRLVTHNAAATTVVVTAVPVVGGAWIKLAFHVTDVPNEVQFFINGVLAGTITTNLPAGLHGWGYRILKSAGLLSRTLLVDYFRMNERFTVPR